MLPFFPCREFYYIQMEKYARQAISEGLKTADDLHVAGDSELYRVLNLHYNRNNHIEVREVRFCPIFLFKSTSTVTQYSFCVSFFNSSSSSILKILVFLYHKHGKLHSKTQTVIFFFIFVYYTIIVYS